MIGSLAFGFAWGPLEGFYRSGAMGSVTIAQAIGVPFPVVAAGVVAMAIGCFVGAEKLERSSRRRRGKIAPPSTRPLRNRQFAVLGTIAVLGLVTVALPARQAAPAAKAVAKIGARRARAEDRRRPAVALDRRPARPEERPAPSGFPGRRRFPPTPLPRSSRRRLPATRTLVAYAQGDVSSLPEGLATFPGEVLVLAGGYDAWRAPSLPRRSCPPTPTPTLIAEFRMKSALNGYFTGAAAAPPPKLVVRAVAAPAPKKGGGC